MPYSDQVDAEPVRRHLRALLAGGMSVAQIQNLSGVNRTAIRVIIGEFPGRKPSVQVRELTASRILRTRLEPTSVIEGWVPSLGTVRRLQALQALGWTQRALSIRLGYPSRQLQVARGPHVFASTALAVDELYRELADQEPPAGRPASRTRNAAAARGWLAPIWWDDDTIDDPDADPRADAAAAAGVELDEVKVARLLAGALQLAAWDRSPERVEAVRRLAARGLTDREIGDRLGMSQDAVQKTRARHDILAGQACDAGYDTAISVMAG